MRTITAGVAALLIATGCTKTKEPLPPHDGEVIQRHDPRDVDQCVEQPYLAWCERACTLNEKASFCYA